MTKTALIAQSFTPLSEARILEIVANAEPFAEMMRPIAANVKEAMKNEKYAALFSHQGEKDVNFLNQNLQEIAEFLRDCRLLGCENETGPVNNSNYIIGAEAVVLINEYLTAKPKTAEEQKKSHQIVVIKNSDLCTVDGSKRCSDILMENAGIHTAWAKRLNADLDEAKEAATALNRTYLIETFGTTGMNHWVAVTVRKEINEEQPLIDFFDSSPGLMRGGLYLLQNSIANGYSATVTVNATLTSVLGENFAQEKFFNNSEMFQMAGHSYCGTFAYQKAHITATMDRKEHEDLLKKHYTFTNPFCGGMTEILLDKDEIMAVGRVQNPKLNLPAQYMFMSHFNSNVDSYLDGMQLPTHKTKDGSESDAERRAKYMQNSLTNSLIEQKVLRQKYGHLFEIVTFTKFLELAEERSEAKVTSNSKIADNPDPLAQQIITALREFVPMLTKVSQCSLQEDNYEASIAYLSRRNAERIEKWAEDRGFKASNLVEKYNQDHGFKLTGVDEGTFQRVSTTLKMPRDLALTKINESALECKAARKARNPDDNGTPLIHVWYEIVSNLFQPPSPSPEQATKLKKLAEDQVVTVGKV